MISHHYAPRPKADRDIADAMAASDLLAVVALPDGGFYIVRGTLKADRRPLAEILADSCDSRALQAVGVLVGVG